METILVLLLAFLAAVSGCDLPLAWTGARLHAGASEARSGPPCEDLAGEVLEGRAFERSFGDDLLFRLAPAANAPPNPTGWTIEVREGKEGEHDFVWVATPPYRFWNPRYLTVSYGLSARDVIERDERDFGFVTDEEEYEELAEVVRFLLWKPPELSKARYDAAYDSVQARWETLVERAGRGRLWITEADVTGPEPGHTGGRIERIAFGVTLCQTVHERLAPFR